MHERKVISFMLLCLRTIAGPQLSTVPSSSWISSIVYESTSYRVEVRFWAKTRSARVRSMCLPCILWSMQRMLHEMPDDTPFFLSIRLRCVCCPCDKDIGRSIPISFSLVQSCTMLISLPTSSWCGRIADTKRKHTRREWYDRFCCFWCCIQQREPYMQRCWELR